MGNLNRLFDLNGKVALVTGGTSGIGLLIARGLVEAGVEVFVVARTADACSKVAADLSQIGKCQAIKGDLSSLDGIRAVAAEFEKASGRLHILVNNAGLMEAKPIENYSEELWDRALDLNLKAPFFLVQQLLPSLRNGASDEDPARVINISSGHGLRISPFDHFGYTASKAGLHHLTRALAQRLAGANINVNAIAPGIFKSAITAGFSEELVSQILSGIPRARFGSEEDIVGAVTYLASRAGAYTTSTVLSVDGGWAGIS